MASRWPVSTASGTITPASLTLAAATDTKTQLVFPAAALAQAVERNLPPGEKTTPAVLPGPNAAPDQQDQTPIGPALRAIVLLGASEPVHDQASDGVDVAGAARLAAADNIDHAKAALRPFLGQPLSRKLIAQIEAAIAKRYRASGYPFVSISTPEQEITNGVLQVRVVEFVAGSVTAHGATDAESKLITDTVALKPGDAIDAPQLASELSWLNRYPFRQTSAVFTPGKALGSSDLVLTTNETKPWSVYAGYANSGSPQTSFDRYFVGGSLGGLFGQDSLTSYQATASEDAIAGTAHPHYRSQAVTVSVPVNSTGQVEASFDWVASNQSTTGTGPPFVVDEVTWEGSLGYRFALPRLLSLAGDSDARFGLERRGLRPSARAQGCVRA